MYFFSVKCLLYLSNRKINLIIVGPSNSFAHMGAVIILKSYQFLCFFIFFLFPTSSVALIMY